MKMIKKTMVMFLIILGLIVAGPLSSQADNHHGHWKHYHGYNHNHPHYVDYNFYYRPYYPKRYIYYEPPPVVYYEPAPYTVPYYYPPVRSGLFFGINID